MKKNKIIINNRNIEVKLSQDNNDYISLTDMAKFKDTQSTGIVIVNWLTTKYTIEFMGSWEQLYNPNFNVMEFHNIRNEAGSNGFIVSAKRWIEKTKAIGIRSTSGRYGGTFWNDCIGAEKQKQGQGREYSRLF